METVNTQTQVVLKNFLPKTGMDVLRSEIIHGLRKKKKRLNSKFFYDDRGSELFEKITALPEYYPTRTEKSIIREVSSDVMNRLDGHEIIELGSGDCSKITLLLNGRDGDLYDDLHYLPVDFSPAALEKSAGILSASYNGIRITAIAADFTTQLDMIPRSGPALICFFGGTIGNLESNDAAKMLRNIGTFMREGDVLLLGLDMVKPVNVLLDAYNDSQSVTAAFNKNILRVANAIAGFDFDESRFVHRAIYDTGRQRIEMHLIAKENMEVSSELTDEPVRFRKGESIHTENSHKYDPAAIRKLAAGAGLQIRKVHHDPRKWFALVEMVK